MQLKSTLMYLYVGHIWQYLQFFRHQPVWVLKVRKSVVGE